MSNNQTVKIHVVKHYGPAGDALLALLDRLLPLRDELLGGAKRTPLKRDREEIGPLLADALAATIRRPSERS